MSRRPSSDLFDLVKSLTKSEKRQFKLFASRHATGDRTKYVLLFDALDRQSAYDEEGLLSGSPSLRSVDLRSMKNHLYNLILRSLRSLPVRQATAIGVGHRIEEAVLLMRKGLYGQAARLLAKAKQVAHEHDHLLRYLEIVFLESELKVRLERTNTIGRHRELFAQTLDTLDKLRENAEYYDLFMQIHYLQLEARLYDVSDGRTNLERLIGHPLLREEASQTTFYAAMQYHEVHLRDASLRGDQTKSFEYARRKLDLFDANPSKRAANLYEYIYTCGFYLIMCVKLRKYDEFDTRLELLKGFEGAAGPRRVDLQMNVAYAELAYLMKRCRFDRAREMVPRIDAMLSNAEGRVEQAAVMSFHAAFATLYLFMGDMRELLLQIGRIRQNRAIPGHPYFEEFARLLSLIAYFELGDDRALDSGIRSTYRYLAGRNRLGEFQRVVLRFLKRLPAVTNRQSLLRELVRFREELLALSDREGSETPMLSQIKLVHWLESKIEGRPFADLLREREAEMIDAELQLEREMAAMDAEAGT